MGLFRRESTSVDEKPVKEKVVKMLSDNKFELYVGKTTVLENTTLVLQGNARIDGSVTGKISAKQLEIGPEGSFKGKVEADRIILDGLIDSGDETVSSTGLIEIRETGRLRGTINYASLTCVAGGEISGTISPLKKNEKEKA